MALSIETVQLPLSMEIRQVTTCAVFMQVLSWHFLLLSLSNSRQHLANVDAIADVKSKIIVSRRHFFADVIYSAT